MVVDRGLFVLILFQRKTQSQVSRLQTSGSMLYVVNDVMDVVARMSLPAYHDKSLSI